MAHVMEENFLIGIFAPIPTILPIVSFLLQKAGQTTLFIIGNFQSAFLFFD
jgi:hypothetical protein